MNNSIARSRRRRAVGPLGVDTEAVASGSFVLDPAFGSSFEEGFATESDRQVSGSGMWGGSNGGGGGGGGGKGQDNFGVEALSDAPRSSGDQFMALLSGGGAYGGSNSSLFSGMQMFGSQQPPQQHAVGMQQQQRQQSMQSFGAGLGGWQNMLGSQQSLVQSQALLQGLGFISDQGLTLSNSLGHHQVPAEENWIGRDGDGIRNGEMSVSGDSSESDDSSKGEGSRRRERKEKSRKGGNAGEKFRKKFRGNEKGEEKSDLFRADGEPSNSSKNGFKMRKEKHKHSRRERSAACGAGLSEKNLNVEFLASSSDSGFSSDYSDKDEEGWNKKRKRAGQDADGNITWTDESVKFLFETYDAIHQRLWKESNGHVKYQKKWTPILKAMQDKFGRHFSKKQCQSKYWSVRRECADYRNMSAKAARSDPSWNPSIAGRELLKPKFYDVWFEVSGKKQGIVTNSNSTKTGGVKDWGASSRDPKASGPNFSWKVVGKDGQPGKHKVEDCGNALRDMQQLMQAQLQVSEKREEAMKFRAELMMDLLMQHMEHVERRVNSLDDGRQPQLYLLERVNHKLEKVLEGFTALNENLSIVAFKFTQKQSSLG